MLIQPKFQTLSDLLANRLFRIPEYQRAYSWEAKHRQDMFDDIRATADKPDRGHFMATIVGLQRDKTTIVTDEYSVIEVVDGQQRLTTLVLLLKAIQLGLNSELTAHEKLARELQELLVKPDNVSLILLQTNHDLSHYFVDYLRKGTHPDPIEAASLSDRALLSAMRECESFVNEWKDPIQLTSLLKNRLTFIFHEIGDEATVFTVFEVLNSRGMAVPWLDRLKSTLMAIAFEHSKGNTQETIEELHSIWCSIYRTIGLRQGIRSEALRFGATLRRETRPSKPLGEEDAVKSLLEQCGTQPSEAIEISRWVLKVTQAVDRLMQTGRRSRAVTQIAQARLLAVSVVLRGFPEKEEQQLLELWERVSFRIFGLCRKDARTEDILNLVEIGE